MPGPTKTILDLAPRGSAETPDSVEIQRIQKWHTHSTALEMLQVVRRNHCQTRTHSGQLRILLSQQRLQHPLLLGRPVSIDSLATLDRTRHIKRQKPLLHHKNSITPRLQRPSKREMFRSSGIPAMVAQQHPLTRCFSQWPIFPFSVPQRPEP